MELADKNYKLRKWDSGDAPALATYADNPRIARNLRDAFPSPYTLQDAQAYIEFAASSPTIFAIATAQEAIGSIGLLPQEDIHHRTAELGYWLAEPYWGRGIITDAVHAICRYGFETLNLLRIYAEPFAGNKASARVLEKAGFELEGRLRASALKQGEVLDQLMYALVAPSLANSRR